MFEFFDLIKDWLTSGIYQFFQDAYGWFIKKAIIAYFEYLLWALQFAWGIAQEILTDLHISDQVNTAFASLPPDVQSKARFFRIPEALSIVMSGLLTKFVLRFIPGL